MNLFLIPQTVLSVGEVDVIAVIAIGVDGDTSALGVAITENIHQWCFRQKCIDLCQRGDIYVFKRWCSLHFFQSKWEIVCLLSGQSGGLFHHRFLSVVNIDALRSGYAIQQLSINGVP